MHLPLIVALVGLATAAAALPYKGRTFTSERQAQWECRGGEVVWVDPASGRWFRKGDGRYADTDGGAYACRRDVDGTAARTPKPAPPAPPPAPNYDEE